MVVEQNRNNCKFLQCKEDPVEWSSWQAGNLWQDFRAGSARGQTGEQYGVV